MKSLFALAKKPSINNETQRLLPKGTPLSDGQSQGHYTISDAFSAQPALTGGGHGGGYMPSNVDSQADLSERGVAEDPMMAQAMAAIGNMAEAESKAKSNASTVAIPLKSQGQDKAQHQQDKESRQAKNQLYKLKKNLNLALYDSRKLNSKHGQQLPSNIGKVTDSIRMGRIDLKALAQELPKITGYICDVPKEMAQLKVGLKNMFIAMTKSINQQLVTEKTDIATKKSGEVDESHCKDLSLYLREASLKMKLAKEISAPGAEARAIVRGEGKEGERQSLFSEQELIEIDAIDKAVGEFCTFVESLLRKMQQPVAVRSTFV